ncbi:peptide methionine sulfoxide reductase [Austwickia chelonae NBRC 105200]|uniref:peptide-methionine (R)-S-oxide reductase n=1 Tax=Austwickia chelonae NBRC 105200 TaxID=1184607 RepID=K6W642_9MICO|nr:peptide methionine sulfoxide reductase [Austwickia chelonae NBRC 105200]
MQRSEDEWARILSPQEFHVLRRGGTEPPGTGEHTDNSAEGTYCCAGCSSELFTSRTKFPTGCGWPAFYEPIDRNAVEYLEDTSHGMTRTEVRCASCGSHLGHVFVGEGYGTPTDRRYCVNSISLRFNRADQD